MNIQPMSTNTPMQKSFKGKFVNTPTLQKAIKKAPTEELLKLNDLLKLMSEKNDGLVFSLEKSKTIFPHINLKVFNPVERLTQIGRLLSDTMVEGSELKLNRADLYLLNKKDIGKTVTVKKVENGVTVNKTGIFTKIQKNEEADPEYILRIPPVLRDHDDSKYMEEVVPALVKRLESIYGKDSLTAEKRNVYIDSINKTLGK
jgi:hypothetical protein